MKKSIQYMFRNWVAWDRRNLVYAFLRVPVMIILPTLSALIPKLMIDYVTAQAPVNELIKMIVAVSGAFAFLSWLRPALEEKIAAFQQNVGMHFSILAFEKLLRMDYANLERYENRLLFERCQTFAFSGRRSYGSRSIWHITELCISLLGIAAYLALLGKVNPLLLLILAAACALEFTCHYALVKLNVKFNDRGSPQEMRFRYFFRLATDPGPGKDIRLSGAKNWLLGLLEQTFEAYTKLLRWYTGQSLKLSSLQALCALARDAATYAFLIAAVLRGNTNVADFLFYFGLITGFSGWVNGISWQINGLREAAEECEKFREFLDIPDRAQENTAPAAFAHIENIEFRDVRFSYDGESEALCGIDFTVRGGEKIAIVGENGAGKTTLIKLLCGLYAPADGQVLVNGQGIESLERESYFNLFSAVFQDYTFLPSTILANIAIAQGADEEDIKAVLEKAGLLEKIESLEGKLQAKLVKQLNAEAAELSGGEKQRLLLARALYKNAPVLILDEPTAALDPIAEEKLYRQYHALTADKTAFYVSHRLSSTQFCDRIFYMRDGEIAEAGSHEELMALRGGYWRMFQTQGYYYRQEAAQA